MFSKVITHLGNTASDFILQLIVVLFVPVIRDLKFTEHGIVGFAVKGFGLREEGRGGEGREG